MDHRSGWQHPFYPIVIIGQARQRMAVEIAQLKKRLEMKRERVDRERVALADAKRALVKDGNCRCCFLYLLDCVCTFCLLLRPAYFG
jgi:hypothetical protein